MEKHIFCVEVTGSARVASALRPIRTTGAIPQNFARKKVWDTGKRKKHKVHNACSDMNVVVPSTKSSFSI